MPATPTGETAAGVIGVYPGTFNPPTVAHLAIAEAAAEQAGLDRVELVISRVALGKEDLEQPSPQERLAVLLAVAATRPWLGARTTTDQLLADIAAGADAVVVGADKWAQIVDPVWYGGSTTSRDAALERLPLILVAPRPPFPLPQDQPGRVQSLYLDPGHRPVSSSAVRAGQRTWMLDEAHASGLWPAGAANGDT
jgi:nicotinic acid mononucleotide adenylyltransferase